MPKATSLTDRRKHGRGDNAPGVAQGKSNLQDQRKKGAYAPQAPTTHSEFTAGVTVARPMSAGVPAGGSKRRAAPAVKKLGEKK